MASQQEVAVAEAEAEAFESMNTVDNPQLQNLDKLEISKPLDPMARTFQYVYDQSALNQNSVNPDNVLVTLTPKPHGPITETFQNVIDQQAMNNKNIDTNDYVPVTGKTVLNQDEHSFSYLTKFLLKKDMLLTRLSWFNDRPDSYAFWKSQFKGIMEELSVTINEELDLLSK